MSVPTVTSVSPILGPPAGGTLVTVVGRGFTGDTAVHFGSAAGTSLAVASETLLYVTSPAGTGAVDVTVTNGSGTSATSAADTYTYAASNYTPKYTTLAAFEAYMRAQVPPGSSATVGDETALLNAIALAEDGIDCEIASHLEYRTNTLERAEIAFIDTAGWVHLQLMHPVIAVTEIQTMNRYLGETDWTTLTVKQQFPGRPPTLYPNDPPNLRSYMCEVYSSDPELSATPTGGVLAQVTYTSGYATIPAAVTAVTNRYAYWVYQLREMPMGKVADLENRIITVPLDMPRDVKATLRHWRRENF